MCRKDDYYIIEGAVKSSQRFIDTPNLTRNRFFLIANSLIEINSRKRDTIVKFVSIRNDRVLMHSHRFTFWVNL